MQKVWPGDNPFIHDRHQIMKAVKHELGPAGRDLNFNAYADNRSLFRYDMHTLPSEISGLLDRHLDAVRGLERRDLRGAGRRPRVAEAAARRPLSRRHARGAAEARRALVLRRILRDLAPARLTCVAPLPDGRTDDVRAGARPPTGLTDRSGAIAALPARLFARSDGAGACRYRRAETGRPRAARTSISQPVPGRPCREARRGRGPRARSGLRAGAASRGPRHVASPAVLDDLLSRL